MSHTVNYTDVLKMLFNFDFIIILLVFILIPILLVFAIKEKHRIVSILLMLSILPLPAIIISEAGSGWVLTDNTLKIRASTEEESIDLLSAEIMLVSSQEWQPAGKIVGFSTAGLTTGCFNLKNGKKAVVFWHNASSNSLVLLYKNQYYLLSNPGIENLYNELLKRNVPSISLN